MSNDCFDCKRFDGNTVCKIHGWIDPDVRRYGCVKHTYHDDGYIPKRFYIPPCVKLISLQYSSFYIRKFYKVSQLSLFD